MTFSRSIGFFWEEASWNAANSSLVQGQWQRALPESFMLLL
jgi:hypothetical protein